MSRRLNATLHRMAVTQIRSHGPTKVFLERTRAEGKSTREAACCLKRHLVRTVWRALRAAEGRRQGMLNPANPLPGFVLATAS